MSKPSTCWSTTSIPVWSYVHCQNRPEVSQVASQHPVSEGQVASWLEPLAETSLKWYTDWALNTPIPMKGTEVPNPQRNSACDCTCVLTRNWSLSRDSLMLAMRIVLFLCKVCSWVSDALSQALCNSSLAFLADFTLSDYTAPICVFSRKLHSAFHLDWKTRLQSSRLLSYRYSSLHCRHTFVGGILNANGQ